VAAFKAHPGRNVGHKLETVVYLELRRTRKDLFYHLNGSEVDLCDSEGTFFINTCWSLTDVETRQRESKAMAAGRASWPDARGHLLYHEYSPGIETEIPESMPAWKYLIGAAYPGT